MCYIELSRSSMLDTIGRNFEILMATNCIINKKIKEGKV